MKKFNPNITTVLVVKIANKTKLLTIINNIILTLIHALLL